MRLCNKRMRNERFFWNCTSDNDGVRCGLWSREKYNIGCSRPTLLTENNGFKDHMNQRTSIFGKITLITRILSQPMCDSWIFTHIYSNITHIRLLCLPNFTHIRLQKCTRSVPFRRNPCSHDRSLKIGTKTGTVPWNIRIMGKYSFRTKE